jgi:hypothetical protein
VSRRKRRPGGAPAGGGEPAERGVRRGVRPGDGSAPRGAGPAEPAPARAERASSRRIAVDLTVLVAVFAAAAGIAELAGAANLGVALGVGQVAFAVALVVLLLRA